MSSDDFILIFKEKRKYKGYRRFMSCSEGQSPRHGEEPELIATSLREAIKKAQELPSEYGYWFANLWERSK